MIDTTHATILDVLHKDTHLTDAALNAAIVKMLETGAIRATKLLQAGSRSGRLILELVRDDMR